MSDEVILSQFQRVVSRCDAGYLDERLSAEVTRIVKAMREHGGKGVISLTLAFSIDQRDQVVIKPDLKVKLPEPDVGVSGPLFADDEGRLYVDDPKQQRLPLKEAPARPAVVRNLEPNGTKPN